MELTPADVLDRAADLIEEKGWCQHRYKGYFGAYCALGAINEINYGNPSGVVGTKAEAEVLLEGKLGLDVARWNDAWEQTAEAVIDTLRDVARGLRDE